MALMKTENELNPNVFVKGKTWERMRFKAPAR